jgi:hypothetical protein
MRQRVTSHSFASLAAARIPVTGNLLRLAHLCYTRRRGRALHPHAALVLKSDG